MNKGQTSVLVSIITAGGILLASIFTSWATANNRVGMTEKNVAVLEEREGNHFLELKKDLGRIEDKLDKVLNAKK